MGLPYFALGGRPRFLGGGGGSVTAGFGFGGRPRFLGGGGGSVTSGFGLGGRPRFLGRSPESACVAGIVTSTSEMSVFLPLGTFARAGAAAALAGFFLGASSSSESPSLSPSPSSGFSVSDSGVSGRIYTLMGAEVASMTHVHAPNGGCTSGTTPQYATWDGRTTEGTVRSGIYVYRIEAEGKTYAGTLLVVR